MSLVHVYSQTVADGTATSVVRPSDWNSAHRQTMVLAGNTAGASSVSGTDIVFQGGNNVVLSGIQGANVATVIISGSNAAGFNGGVSNIGNTSGNTGMQTGSFVLSGGNNITLSVATAVGGNQTVGISGLDVVWNLTGAQTAGTTSSNLSANSFYYSAAGNLTLSGNNKTIVFQAGNSGVTTTTQAGSTMGVTNNSAGLSLAVPAWLTDAAGGAFGAGVSTDAAGTTGTVNGQVVFFEGNTNITLSQSVNGNSASISIFGPSPGGGGAANTNFWFQPEVYGNTMTSAHANGTVYIRPFELDGNYDADKYIMQQSFASSASTLSISASVSAGSASSGTGSWGQTGTQLLFSLVNNGETHASYNSIVSFQSDTYSMSAGYSLSASWSTNASSATCSWTTSAAFGFIKNIDGNGGFTTGSTATSGSSTFSSTSTAANSFSSSYIMSFPYAHASGIRPLFIPGPGINLAPGEYWYGLIQSTSTGSTNYPLQRVAMLSNPGMLYYTASSNNYLEIGNSVNMSTSNFRLGFGSFSASSATTGNIALTNITTMGSNASLYFAIDGKTK